MEKIGSVLIAVCGLLVSGVTAQNGTTTDPVIMTVDGRTVPRSEFEAIYKKNNKDAQVTKADLDEYLDLFINYKLKVREAETLGMDTISKFRNELDGYRKQLARPYLIDRELNESLMQEAFDRMQQEVRASHILVQVAADASPEDTLIAWKRITALRERVMKGEDFASVAQGKGGSEDPSAAKNGGDLGWFSALQMVYPFESAAYNTKPGEVSPPVRTRFGYHIIKVVDRRPARGQVKVAHIMMRSTDQETPEKQAAIEQRIKEVHGQIASGKLPFADAALKYSEDESSNTKGGELPMFGTGKMIEEFEDAAFALNNDGDLSAPIKSRYGWHIIKLLEKQPLPSYDGAKTELKNKIARDSRAELTQKVFIERLRKDHGYTAYPQNLKAVMAMVDSSVFKKGTSISDTLIRKNVVEGPFVENGKRYRREVLGSMKDGHMMNVKSKQYDEMPQTMEDTVVVRTIMEGWTYDRKKAEKMTKPVFAFKGGTYTQKDLLDHIDAKQRRERVIPIKELVETRFNEFADERIIGYEDQNLEAKYTEFRLLMKEYRDGILLFELTDQKVWGKAVRDTAGLEAFYEANKLDFMWDTRFDADLYICSSTVVAKEVRGLLKKGKRGDALLAIVNKTDPLALSIESGLFTAESKPYLKGMSKPGLGPDVQVDGSVLIADIKGVRVPEPKTMDEARGLITAAYQDSLEKAWIAELRAKYPVTVDQDVLYSIK
ncbi:MAG: peptidylprolyl isomerase [Flavobacteriales bacterium]|jgi:peptidyl-prolyl cis-trans isomerase SurA|nr:peptidylprolyl isomerase [Flavobacteriales bacterium]MBK7101188.1 peptidylprolyl isomerase [Flavobacteriales bacterium]MBK7111909.1 peptidylprolyl isomerase [Flavobacteriales bacterium]MBK7619061.1 peptidylprolyl isomerase [Flavobacteriales bacterium]MBK8707719.1 peptidylprolyl isomerase [Flavobacteriales bacterium]